MLFLKPEELEFVEVAERGNKGFGSTGKYGACTLYETL